MVTFAKIIVAILVVVHITFVLVWGAAGTLFYIRDYYAPTLKFTRPLGKAHLGNSGPSTENFEDIVVRDDMTPVEAHDLADKHGLAIVESVLTKQTSENFRNYILDANQNIESDYVHMPRNRFHIMPDLDEPAVQDVLIEIADHPVLRPLIDNLLGPSASLVTFSVITNLYGAVDQNWHWDTVTSHAGYPHDFVPEYTLAIPVQDTTEAMGATGICPGTHKSEWPDFNYDELERYYEENIEGWEDFDDWLEHNLPCPLTAAVNAGDGLLYNTDVYHRGHGHTDPDAPERVVAFLSFAGSPKGPEEKRSLPLGTVHTLRWNSWGHTIDDFSTIKEKPWRVWHTFGLFRPKHDSGIHAWTLLDDLSLIFRSSRERAHVISHGFDAEYFNALVGDVLTYTFIATGVYLMVAPFFVLLLLMVSLSQNKSTTTTTEVSKKDKDD
eukprot:CAMPEP_0195297528 /NCGR_PEP_ID=MMETSP0707-20130614/21699_1 /TAXON_ID=33640 /ORGANISM="Asterionellopsis glacialis, Strain CCMP134" /LENGTH=438 /DNA_ID=CAMNT_0040359367 /DNA_START=224 /DNA_END=1540 /DNA_ORIENTATION=-